MEKYLGIKYKLVSTENFDEYLRYIGVGFLIRKVTCSLSPACVLTKDEAEVYTFSMITALKTAKLTFKLNEAFEEVKPDGVKVKSLLTINGATLTQVDTQLIEGGKTTTLIREFTPDLLTETITAEGWEGMCLRIHEAVK